MNQRFYSLDVFRGATVALMILVNNPGNWGHIYAPLDHAEWHGCTPTDLVFPFFLFAVGNAMAFVMPKLEAAGESFFWKKVLKRTALIFIIGLLLNWFPFCFYENDVLVLKTWNHSSINSKGEIFGIRIFGVLQRIAVCYFFASVIVHYFKVRGAFVFSAFLLLGYWFLCVVANQADPFSLSGWFGTNIDVNILGEKHVYHGEGVAFDPEGIMSSFAAIVQVIFGYLIGNYILQKGKTQEMLNALFVTGCILILTGMAWNMVFPLNKKIWTSSYTIYTTGLAVLVLAVMMYLIEFKNVKGAWSKFFDVFGKNALFIFVLSGMLPRLMGLIRIKGAILPNGKQSYLSPFSWFYEYICKPILPVEPRLGSLIYALCFICMMWFFAWLLDKKKIYIKV
jgi:predicted acyltransferase